jgi:NADH dehydrogenase/NADH:ubiquinone oxidoreductase subunit G
MKKYSLILVLIYGLTLLACRPKDVESLDLVSFYRDKIRNQRMMLEDAIEQLQREKEKVNFLKEQVEFNKQQVSEIQRQRDEKRIFVSNTKVTSASSSEEDYLRVKAELDRWKSLINSKETKYRLVKQELDTVLKYLSESKVELVRDGLGKIEKVVLPTMPAASNEKSSTSTSVAASQAYDSLLKLFTSERELSKKTIAQLNKTVNIYAKETSRWKKKFNESGLFLLEHNANFLVNLSTDTISTVGKALFNVKLTRQTQKLKKGIVQVSIACKMPNGNLINTYTGTIEYDKNQPVVAIQNIQPFPIEVSGLHEVIVYLDNKEAYYDDFYFSKK